MRKNILIILVLTLLVSGLSLLAGCGSKEDEDEGIFVPASEEYTILDEGKKDSSSNSSDKKDGSSNTNAKTGSDSKTEDSSSSESGKDVSTTAKPSTSEASGSVSDSGVEDETPFVPATGPGTSGSSSQGSGAVSAGID